MLGKNSGFDKEFYRKYEQALEGLSDEDLGQVAKFNPDRLKEWVSSPPKIRPHLLKKWREERTVGDFLTALDKKASQLAGKIEESHEKRLKQSWFARLAQKLVK